MEMAKADNLEGFLKSTEVLAQYPRQVVLAKEITTATSLRGRKDPHGRLHKKARRYLVAVVPVAFLNAPENELVSLKPTASATSVTDREGVL
jgi:hypothetical protein